MELMQEAGELADRLSANIEMPIDRELQQFAPAKSHLQIETSMIQIHHGIQQAKDLTKRSGETPKFAPAGQSTQMIVGATAAPDAELLKKADGLYKEHKLRRVYYSAFSPIPHADPGLPLQKPPMIREHRLYQADWLMRFYGFKVHELTEPDAPNLSLEQDPKLAWALRHREFFPVDVNKASKSALLRIPGIGLSNVKRIVEIRRYRALALEDLAKLKISVAKVKFFISASGHNPAALQIDSPKLPQRFVPQPQQLALFEARTGEL